MIRTDRAAAQPNVSRAIVGLFFLAAGLASTTTACVLRPSSETLRKQVAELQQENFQLRKDLTEARVRLEMQKERAQGSGGGVPETVPLPGAASAPQDSGDASAKSAAPDAPRVIYSEPITDRSHTLMGSASMGGDGAASLMKDARQKLDAKDPTGALSVFRQIVARYPADALADDAQFGAGECYFQMGRYEEAIAEYQKVVNDFPYGDQVPSAFLKIGFCHLAREQRDLALDNFRTVSEAYPGTEAATVARQQIAHLSRH